ncbi:hypothetical protein HY450_00855 [Candidatus Pacearchaeota archaeon]|nr:hypothetical protein [Candidatus Pacearchaeota archaeon]
MDYKSDYDVFVVFKDKVPKEKKFAQKELRKKFPKVTLQYYCTQDELIQMVNEGHWSVYITLLKGGRVLYKTKIWRKFLRKLRKINFVEEILDTFAMKYKAKFEIDKLKNMKGYEAAKWALPCIRKRLQLLVYVKNHPLK